ncbi:MAG: hypothetical protein UZ17_ACD001002146 [Acidobacteria bacterium OLB17]|nr:MAG: hypothetical protein UZ17_ACD001002146 [Acidobacteria bacterium OLB17]MCZ2391027.1 hypothetical protein [Acidobacteriota bacterium]
MPVNLIAHDTRLEGRTPSASRETFTIQVDDTVALDTFFDQAVNIALVNVGINRLSIMAHGLYVRDMDTTAIQFCSELISFQTVGYFARLRGLVDHIILYVCHAAETEMTSRSEGDQLCRQIAILANAEVTAARERQLYTSTEVCHFFVDCDTTPIEFGDWEGEVVHYGRDGMVLAEYPEIPAPADPAPTHPDPRFTMRR